MINAAASEKAALHLKKQRDAERKERMRETSRRHYYANPKLRLEQTNQYRRLNPDKVRVWQRNRKERARAALLFLLGGAFCSVCGKTERLEIDHKMGGGYKDRMSKGKTSYTMIRYYVKHPEEAKEKLQILCKKHNLEKMFLRGEGRRDMTGRSCHNCGSVHTNNGSWGGPAWLKDGLNWLCTRCYYRKRYHRVKKTADPTRWMTSRNKNTGSGALFREAQHSQCDLHARRQYEIE